MIAGALSMTVRNDCGAVSIIAGASSMIARAWLPSLVSAMPSAISEQMSGFCNAQLFLAWGAFLFFVVVVVSVMLISF